jgi:hypothetical protein
LASCPLANGSLNNVGGCIGNIVRPRRRSDLISDDLQFWTLARAAKNRSYEITAA